MENDIWVDFEIALGTYFKSLVWWSCRGRKTDVGENTFLVKR
jgi:hypothetical protein